MLEAYQIILTKEDRDFINLKRWTDAAKESPKINAYLIMNGINPEFQPEFFEHYTHVANVETDDLERALDTLNDHGKDKFTRINDQMKSLSVGDILIDEGHQAHLVSSVGFVDVQVEEDLVMEPS